MRCITEANQLTIRLEGLEQVWALKRRLQIPHFAIAAVDFLAQEPALQDYKGYVRLPGTALPWRFLAGSYNRGGQREFWYVHMQQAGVLIITLKPETWKYDKIRVTCSPQVAQSIADWWQERK